MGLRALVLCATGCSAILDFNFSKTAPDLSMSFPISHLDSVDFDGRAPDFPAQIWRIDTSHLSLVGDSGDVQLPIDQFHLVGTVAVLFVHDMTVQHRVEVVGLHPLIIVASGDVDVQTTLDASGAAVTLRSPDAGALADLNLGLDQLTRGTALAGGSGIPKVLFGGVNPFGTGIFSAGGGGGLGTFGGAGGVAYTGFTNVVPGGAGGGTAVTDFSPGGTGGGGGEYDEKCLTWVTSLNAGGSGGEALQISAKGSITVGGLIDASGAGGDNRCLSAAGGGGGAGGTIFLEAPTVTVTGQLAANGGGGASSSDDSSIGVRGAAGQPGSAPAAGGTLANNCPGGNGGTSSMQATSSNGCILRTRGGGGGGAVGQVWIRTLVGGATVSGASSNPPPHFTSF
jgi:hypothetical protein